MKKLLTIIILVSLLVTSIPTGAFAVSENTFEVSLFVPSTADTTPPSIPDGLIATTISQSEIDLSWNASTDDNAVASYKIYRDGLYVGSSLITSYSDTGLDSGTTYAYQISAVDTSTNESDKSAITTATTLTAVVPTVTPTTTQPYAQYGQFAIPQFLNFAVKSEMVSAEISWHTDPLVLAIVSWGETDDYGLGSLGNVSPAQNHKFILNGLKAGTEYYFRTEITDKFGTKNTLRGKFTTKFAPDNIPPINVSAFDAKPVSNYINLSWKNPKDVDFAGVRIVRSDRFFPKDPNDGVLVFDGRANSFKDRDVATGKNYFYTIFAKDYSGNFSSGVVASARIPLAGELVTPVSGEDVFEGLPVSEIKDTRIDNLTLSDFDFIQDGLKITAGKDGSLPVNGNKNLTISIAYEKVPEVLKTIALTFKSPTDGAGSFSFLLGINKDKTAYTATVAPFEKSGKYSFVAHILDYKNQKLKKINGLAVVSVTPSLVQSEPAKFAGFITAGFGILFLILIIVIILYFFRRFFHKKNNEEKA